MTQTNSETPKLMTAMMEELKGKFDHNSFSSSDLLQVYQMGFDPQIAVNDEPIPDAEHSMHCIYWDYKPYSCESCKSLLEAF